MARRHRVAVLLMAVAALFTPLLVPVAAAQEPAGDCRRGVLIEGRCVSVDGQAPSCLENAPCVEFVSDASPRCPDGSTATEDGGCERFEPAALVRSCPEGARGDAGDCHIYLATFENGCPAAAPIPDNGNCRQDVADTESLSCGLQFRLQGDRCAIPVDMEIPACATDTVRFDQACWRLTGAEVPEACDEERTVTLASGRCREPRPVLTGAAACQESSIYASAPEQVYRNAGGTIEVGTHRGVCVGEQVQGGWVSSCQFFDDDYWWLNISAEGCTRFESPLVATCPAGHSLDDWAGGQCARAVFEVDGACPEGSEEAFSWCLFIVDWAAFECPQGMEPWRNVTCAAVRDAQSRIGCSETAAMVLIDQADPSAGYGCFELVGPQPDVCNGVGGVEDCHVILEPEATPCVLGSGCLALTEVSIPGDVDCDAQVNIIDALLIAQYTALIREGHGSCADLVPSAQLFVGDGDVNGDELVDIIDALLVAQCDAGLPVLEGCG